MSALIDKVKLWVQASGFSLELAAASQLRSLGFEVVQSEYYADPDTDELREIDIVASLQSPLPQGPLLVQLVIECKVSIEHPWVMFTAPRTLARALAVERRAASDAGRALLARISKWNLVQDLPYFRLPERIGYSLTTASLSKGAAKDLAFEAVWSATKACPKLVAKAARADPAAAVIALPVVVVRGHLFDATLNPSGEDVIVTAIDSGVLAWRNPVIAQHTLVTIVTEGALPKLASELQQAWPRLVRTAAEAAPR